MSACIFYCCLKLQSMELKSHFLLLQVCFLYMHLLNKSDSNKVVFASGAVWAGCDWKWKTQELAVCMHELSANASFASKKFKPNIFSSDWLFFYENVLLLMFAALYSDILWNQLSVTGPVFTWLYLEHTYRLFFCTKIKVKPEVGVCQDSCVPQKMKTCFY